MNISREHEQKAPSTTSELRGFDLDEVLFETLDSLLEFHNYTLNGKKVSREDFTSYHLHKVPEFNIDLAYSINYFGAFLHSDKVHTIQPVAGAKLFLENLNARGKTCVGITARRDEYKPFTYKAIDTHYPKLLDTLRFANTYSTSVQAVTKSSLCNELSKEYNMPMKYMIEDDLHHAYDIADSGIVVYLLNKPWNKQYSNGMHPKIIKVDSFNNIPLD